MGWTVHYQVLRDRQFSDRELAQLSAHVAAANRPRFAQESFRLWVTRYTNAEQLVAYGTMQVPDSTSESEADRADRQRLCTALTRIAALFPDVRVRLTDDRRVFAWDPGLRVASLDGGTPDPLVQVSDLSSFSDLFRVAPPPVVETACVTELLAGARPSGATLVETMQSLALLPNDHPHQALAAERLAALPATSVVAAGMAAYPDLVGRNVWNAVGSAIETGVDMARFARAFLALWSHPRGHTWHSDMHFPDVALSAFANDPSIQARLCEDVRAASDPTAHETVHRRAEVAARMLGRARSEAAVIALVDTARALRGQELASAQRYYSAVGVYRGLADAEVPAVVPTLLAGVLTGDLQQSHVAGALVPLARLAAGRIAPVLRALARAGELVIETSEALLLAAQHERDDATLVDALRELAALPTLDRQRAASALTELGHFVGDLPALPPPEALVAHRCRPIRDRAIEDLDRRVDPTLVRALCLADALDGMVRREPSRRWLTTTERCAPDIRRAPLSEQLRWIDALQCPLPKQQHLEALAPVARGDLDATAATYPNGWPRATADTLAALEREEATILAALQRGTLAFGGATSALAEPAAIELLAPGTERTGADDAVIDALLRALHPSELTWDEGGGSVRS